MRRAMGEWHDGNRRRRFEHALTILSITTCRRRSVPLSAPAHCADRPALRRVFRHSLATGVPRLHWSMSTPPLVPAAYSGHASACTRTTRAGSSTAANLTSSRDTMPNGTARSPIAFPQGLRRVIAGWDLGFEGMAVGGKRRLFIPYQLAYGDAGRPPLIPPKSALIFDIELMAIADTMAMASASRADSVVRRPPATPTQCPTWEAVRSR